VATDRVKNADGTSSALSIIQDYCGQIDVEINKMKGEWERLEPSYQSTGAKVFFDACHAIEKDARGLIRDAQGVEDALRESGQLFNVFTQEDEAAARKVAEGNDVGNSNQAYNYAISSTSTTSRDI
jgi:uncharacterized protein YukE